jgi:hypothetical protein
MKAISFSAVEILPALLSREKTQTIRPAMIEIKYKDVEDNAIASLPRFKPYEQVQIIWKQRTSPKGAKFCRHCGLEEREIEYRPGEHDRMIRTDMWFPKILGTVEITEVFQIEMGKDRVKVPIEGRLYLSDRKNEYNTLFLARLDGFETSRQMFLWFDRYYDLSQPKRFWVYRWKWV